MTVPLTRGRSAAAALRRLGQAPRPVLFLDVDGTLAPFVTHPDAARVPAATRRTIRQLRRSGARIVLVSGRSTHGASAVARLPADAVLGNHGADLLRNGKLQRWTRVDQRLVGRAAAALREVVARWPRARLEEKEHSLAVHYREAPHLYRPLLRAVRAGLRGSELQVRPGNHVLDIRAASANKGLAVVRWLETVERGSVPLEHVLYAGDDTTDEDAFRALGRRAVTVAVGRRTTGARFRTASPRTFARWLGRLADLRQQKPGG